MPLANLNLLTYILLFAVIVSGLVIYYNIKAIKRLSTHACIDSLTNVYNRRFFDNFIENKLYLSKDSPDTETSIIMIDIDYFKTFNDNYGHEAGDYILSSFAALVKKSVRKTDVVARYGGEEFVVILPASGVSTAIAVAERIRLSLKALPDHYQNDLFIQPVTCSIGVSTFPTLCDMKKHLLKTSDIALYKAKNEGRDCIRIYHEGTLQA